MRDTASHERVGNDAATVDTMNLMERITQIHPVATERYKAAQQRLDSLTKPPGSLGRLEEFARRLVAIYQNQMPEIPR